MGSNSWIEGSNRFEWLLRQPPSPDGYMPQGNNDWSGVHDTAQQDAMPRDDVINLGVSQRASEASVMGLLYTA
jgi:hypothetical protein